MSGLREISQRRLVFVSSVVRRVTLDEVFARVKCLYVIAELLIENFTHS